MILGCLLLAISLYQGIVKVLPCWQKTYIHIVQNICLHTIQCNLAQNFIVPANWTFLFLIYRSTDGHIFVLTLILFHFLHFNCHNLKVIFIRNHPITQVHTNLQKHNWSSSVINRCRYWRQPYENWNSPTDSQLWF